MDGLGILSGSIFSCAHPDTTARIQLELNRREKVKLQDGYKESGGISNMVISSGKTQFFLIIEREIGFHVVIVKVFLFIIDLISLN